MYQALYRKWRPRSFDDVVGQEHITNTLKRQIQTGRLSHAYIFVGTRGTGKTSCAKILSRAVNCEHPVNGNPCNQCPSCLGIESGSILDVEELDAASNNGVDNIRDLRDEAIYTPASVKKRVYIVDEVHMLSNSAFNALLKILEEPPEHLIFILATTEIHKVPATILSRCQRFSFRRISQDKIAGRLSYVAQQEGLNLTAEGASLLARLADGSMRDALSLLDQCASAEEISPNVILDIIGLAGRAETLKLLSAINDNDTATALSVVDGLHAAGKDMSAVLDELITLERDILITKVAGENADRLYSGSFDAPTLVNLAKKISRARLLSGVDVLQQAINDMARSSNRRLCAELCIMRLCDERLSSDNGAILSRLTQLEDKLASGNFTAAPSSQPTVTIDEDDEEEEYVDDFARDLEEFTRHDDFVPVAEYDVIRATDADDFPPFDLDPVPPPPPAPRAAARRKPESAPSKNAAASSPISGCGQWGEILATCQRQNDASTTALLTDCSGVVEGSTLVVYSGNPFIKNMIDTDAIKKKLKDAAEKVLGKHITIRVSDEAAPAVKSEPATKTDKLDALSKFGVTFE